jgi:hypothetical protein
MFSFSEEDLFGVGSINGQIKIKMMNPATTIPIAEPTQSINPYFSSSSLTVYSSKWKFRHPRRDIAFIFSIWFTKSFFQIRLFPNRNEYQAQHHENQKPQSEGNRTKMQGLSQQNQPDSNHHGITHSPIRPLDHQLSRRIKWGRSAFTDLGEQRDCFPTESGSCADQQNSGQRSKIIKTIWKTFEHTTGPRAPDEEGGNDPHHIHRENQKRLDQRSG